VTLPFGILPLVYSLTITSVLFAFLNALYSGKLINYKVIEQIKDISKIFIVGLVVSAISFIIYKNIQGISAIYIILIVGSFYAFAYMLGIFLFDRKMINTVKSLLKK